MSEQSSELPQAVTSLHRGGRNSEGPTLEDLSLTVHSHPVIDNHAHNILKVERADGTADFPFESITSEAHGSALADHVQTSLPHIRAIKQLAQLYGCHESVRAVKAARHEWVKRDYRGLIRTCLEGTHTILMDDGLSKQLVEPFQWHRQFVPRVCRIVRVEAIAAEILEQLALKAGFLRPGIDADWSRDQTEAFFIRFNGEFRNQVRAYANDPDVHGFKSVVCYRTGLDIALTSRNLFRPQRSLTDSPLFSAFHDFLQEAVKTGDYRIQAKPFNDYLVVAVCDVLDTRARSEGESLPFQFHTGLGDSDMSLLTANPAYMQPLVEAYPDVDFVLLHSSYPYTREAGYLATTYANAWLDIGEVFPKISREGQASILRQTMELTPASKILWSTDGYAFPETYWLANRQFRQTLDNVLHKGVAAGDYTLSRAIDMAIDILFQNSNLLYKLGEDPKQLRLVGRGGRRSAELSTRTLVNNASGSDSSNTSLSSQSHKDIIKTPTTPGKDRRGLLDQSPTPTRTLASSDGQSLTQALDHFLRKHPHIKYVWLQILDYTATQRQRMIPIPSFRQQLLTGTSLSMTQGLLRLLQDDHLAPGATTTGEFSIQPDLSTLAVNQGLNSPSATVQAWWMDDESAMHLEGCPRWTLQRQTSQLQSDFHLNVLVGCEVEVVFMRPHLDPASGAYTEFSALHLLHCWSGMTYQQLDLLPIIEEIVEALAAIDIHIPQFHAETAPGQWEFPLPPAEPLVAVDMLYQARNIISFVARNHGLKATFYPKPFAEAPGNGCHAHVSLHGPGDSVARYTNHFLAGILEHLPSLMALTMPCEDSYDRIQPHIWSGGEYVAWGTQNRETPIRKCGREDEAHWEVKVIDGTSNMYLGMAAVLASGADGIARRMTLNHKDCWDNPSRLSGAERADLGVTKKLPRSLLESVAELERDRVLHRALGENFMADYLAVKRAEVAKMSAMPTWERKIWLISRY